MADRYGKMLDAAFGAYYARFRALHATGKEMAVTKDELFPQGQTPLDADRLHKMLSAGIVKRVGLNRYWLNEKRAADSKGILKQRLILVAVVLLLGVLMFIFNKFGIL